MDINGNSTEDPSIAELKAWLFGRVADDNDIVIDDVQNEFGVYYDKMETINDSVEGTEEYKANMEYLTTSIAKLKTKEGRSKIKVEKAQQKKLQMASENVRMVVMLIPKEFPKAMECFCMTIRTAFKESSITEF